jgi:hypothetical protein
MADQAEHARVALEQVCARGDLDRAHELYATDFVDHVKAASRAARGGAAGTMRL